MKIKLDENLPHQLAPAPVYPIPKIDRKRCPRGQSTRLYGNGSRVPCAAANRLATIGHAAPGPICRDISYFVGMPGRGFGTLDLRGRGSGFVLTKPRDARDERDG